MVNEFSLIRLHLQEAVRKPGCPICRIAADTETRYLDFLLRERVNDPGTRAALAESLGFCHAHAWQMLIMECEQCGAALGNSIIQKGLIDQVLQGLQALTQASPAGPNLRNRNGQPVHGGRRRTPRKQLVSLTPTRECPACAASGALTDYSVTSLVELMVEETFRASYACSSGLCLPHLRVALTTAESEPGLPYLIAATEVRLRILRDALSEYVRKQAWKYREEQVTLVERAAIRDAVAFMAGPGGPDGFLPAERLGERRPITGDAPNDVPDEAGDAQIHAL